MTQRDDLDQMLTAWLDDPYTPPAPGYLGEVLDRTRRTRQRPAWTSLERWLPMADKIARPALAPPLRIALLLLIVLLVAALATGLAFVGSQLLKTPRSDSAYPIPQGPAAVFAFGSIDGGVSGQTVGHIFTARADGTDLRQLTNGPGIGSHPTWSPDGTRIAYQVYENGNVSVVIMDSGGKKLATLGTTAQGSLDCVRGGLAWSPDGASLIFQTSPACDSQFDLFVVAADGSLPATKLLAPGINGGFAAWSPDGKRIAFLGSDTTGTRGLYVVDVGPGGARSGGLQARRIALGPIGLNADASGGPRWSPDGADLAFVNDTDGLSIMKPDGSGQRVIAQKVNFSSPTWSPDGRRLAFYRTVDPSEYFQQRPCTIRTFVIDAGGTNERRIDPLGDGCDYPPMWSPDGTRLAYLQIVSTPAMPDLSFHLSIAMVDGGSPVVTLQDTTGGTWQPFAVPLLPAPSFPAVSPSP